MVLDWLIEIMKGIGKAFFNPLLYWFFILLILSSWKRIKEERIYFGFKVFDFFSEWRHVGFSSLLLGIFISIIMIGVGVVFTRETVLAMSFITILLSLNIRYTMLSPSYTIGFSFLFLFLFPLFFQDLPFLDEQWFTKINFPSIAILLGFFLLIEALLMLLHRRNQLFPILTKSKRGIWVGQYHLKSLNMIPFFVLIPTGHLESFAPYWPYFTFGDQVYGLLIFPFLLGFDYSIQSRDPEVAIHSIGKSIQTLGILVLLVGIGSLFVSWLALVAVLLAILGKEGIKFIHRIREREKQPLFSSIDKGLKVFAIIPGTPADRLGLLVGEEIYRVNDQKVTSSDDFYKALQVNAPSFKLEVIDEQGENRFIQSAFYDDDHYKLGIIFAQEPHIHIKSKSS